MSQYYILRRLMQNGGGCGCPTCGQEGGGCGCSGNDFNGGCGCPTCGQEGGGCGCSGNDFNGGCGCPTCGQEGGGCGCSGSMEGGASLKFFFFNKDDAEKGIKDELGIQHKGIMDHFEFTNEKGKSLPDKVGTIEDLKNKLGGQGIKGYIDEKVLYSKLNKRAFIGTEKQKRVELIELKTEAVKMAIKKTVADISDKAGKIKTDIDNAANAFKNGLFEQGDNLAVAAAFEIINSLSQEKRGNVESARTKFINKIKDAGFECKDIGKQTVAAPTTKGGYTESFNDNAFINSIFGTQAGGEIIDSESQDGGAKTAALRNYLSKDGAILKESIVDINNPQTHLIPVVMNCVLVFEKRITGPAKIYGLGVPEGAAGNLVYKSY